MKIKTWISAFRLRTLPLSFASIIAGAAFAWLHGTMNNIAILYLALLTTLFLQVLSNLANDYGDSKHGVDNHKRVGPERAVQSGHISLKEMKIAVILFSALSFLSGVALVLTAFPLDQLLWVVLFLVFGSASIWAAIKYTVGKNPYGYRGMGDIFVFLFFGVLGVLGSYFLFAQSISWDVVLWSFGVGCFSTAVLNLNNMRDIDNDKASGKITIPVRLGLDAAKKYHYSLIVAGLLFFTVVVVLQQVWLVIMTYPIFLAHVNAVKGAQSADLDPQLKRVALTTFLSSIFLAVSVIMHSFLK